MTRDPNKTNLKINQDNYYCYRDTGQFNGNWLKMDIQDAIEAFLNTDELASSDLTDMYFDKFVSAFSCFLKKYAPLERTSRKSRKLMSKPWITKGIFISICQKLKLYRMSLITSWG